MKQFIYIAVLLFTSSNLLGQALIPYKKGDKWGYSNLKGELIIPAKYDLIYPYVKGVSYIHHKENGIKKIGFHIQGSGAFKAPQYATTGFIHSRKMPVKNLKGKWGVIEIFTKSLDQIVPFDYEKIDFKIDKRQIWCYWDELNVHIYSMGGKFEHKLVLDRPKYMGDEEYEIMPERAESTRQYGPRLKTFKKSGGKQGLIRIEGNKRDTLPMAYDGFVAMYYPELDIIPTREGLKWGVLNTKGEIIIPFEYESFPQPVKTSRSINGKSYDGFFYLKKNGKVGLVGLTNQDDSNLGKLEVLIPFEFDKIMATDNFSAFITRVDFKNGLISSSNLETICEPLYHFIWPKEFMVDGQPTYGIRLVTAKKETVFMGPDGTKYWAE